MPVLPPIIPGIYDSATTILNSVRQRLHSRMPSLFPTGGNVLDETQASTLQAFNNAYRRLQENAGDLGMERFYDETIILGIPKVTNLDPASHQEISWFNFFDGTDYQATPVLPGNMMTPLWISERWSNTNFPFPPAEMPNMACKTDGLETNIKVQANGQWEWRGDKICFPGSTMAMDFRIRYRSFLPDIDNVGTTRWWNTAVPVMRCQDALSWWICAEFAAAKAAASTDPETSQVLTSLSVACKAEAMAATGLMVNRDIMKNQRTNVRRQPYGGGSRGQGRGYGWGGGW